MSVYMRTARGGKSNSATPSRFAALVLHFEADTIHRLSLRDISVSEPPDGIRWVHFAGDVERSRDWLQHNSPLDSTHVDALCSQLTRPRFFVDGERNITLTLRTARTNPDAPLDFMSLRLWASSKQVISVSLKTTELVSDFITHLHLQRKSVVSTEQLLLELSRFISAEFTEQVADLEEQLAALEDDWEDKASVRAADLAAVRKRISRIGRHLLPQLDALQETEDVILTMDLPKAMKRRYQDGWREVTNLVQRDMEALSEMRERVAILGESLQQAGTERSNRSMYLLAIIATFFLPLTFLTGLLGMNVAGIPVGDSPRAFWLVCAFMLSVAGLQWLAFRRWHWLR